MAPSTFPDLDASRHRDNRYRVRKARRVRVRGPQIIQHGKESSRAYDYVYNDLYEGGPGDIDATTKRRKRKEEKML